MKAICIFIILIIGLNATNLRLTKLQSNLKYGGGEADTTMDKDEHHDEKHDDNTYVEGWQHGQNHFDKPSDEEIYDAMKKMDMSDEDIMLSHEKYQGLDQHTKDKVTEEFHYLIQNQKNKEDHDGWNFDEVNEEDKNHFKKDMMDEFKHYMDDHEGGEHEGLFSYLFEHEDWEHGMHDDMHGDMSDHHFMNANVEVTNNDYGDVFIHLFLPQMHHFDHEEHHDDMGTGYHDDFEGHDGDHHYYGDDGKGEHDGKDGEHDKDHHKDFLAKKQFPGSKFGPKSHQYAGGVGGHHFLAKAMAEAQKRGLSKAEQMKLLKKYGLLPNFAKKKSQFGGNQSMTIGYDLPHWFAKAKKSEKTQDWCSMMASMVGGPGAKQALKDMGC